MSQWGNLNLGLMNETVGKIKRVGDSCQWGAHSFFLFLFKNRMERTFKIGKNTHELPLFQKNSVLTKILVKKDTRIFWGFWGTPLILENFLFLFVYTYFLCKLLPFRTLEKMLGDVSPVPWLRPCITGVSNYISNF